MALAIRDVLAQAQAAESRRDFVAAIALLQEAQAFYAARAQQTQAARMGRQVERLRAVLLPQEPPVPDDDFGFGDSLEESVPAQPLAERGPTLTAPPDAWCSFCCRPSSEVAPLVAGPAGAYICAGCLGVSRTLLSGASDPVAAVRSTFALWSTQLALKQRWLASSAKVTLLVGAAGVGKSVLAGQLPSAQVYESPASVPAPLVGRVVLVADGALAAASLVVAGQTLYDTTALYEATDKRWPLALMGQVELVLSLSAPPRSELVTALAVQLDAPESQIERLVEHGLHHGPGLHEIFRLARRLTGARAE